MNKTKNCCLFTGYHYARSCLMGATRSKLRKRFCRMMLWIWQLRIHFMKKLF